MKYYTLQGKKLKEVEKELTSLDRAILEKCKVGMNVVRVIKAGKPYVTGGNSKAYASTEEVLASVSKLVKLGVLERR